MNPHAFLDGACPIPPTESEFIAIQKLRRNLILVCDKVDESCWNEKPKRRVEVWDAKFDTVAPGITRKVMLPLAEGRRSRLCEVVSVDDIDNDTDTEMDGYPSTPAETSRTTFKAAAPAEYVVLPAARHKIKRIAQPTTSDGTPLFGRGPPSRLNITQRRERTRRCLKALMEVASPILPTLQSALSPSSLPAIGAIMPDTRNVPDAAAVAALVDLPQGLEEEREERDAVVVRRRIRRGGFLEELGKGGIELSQRRRREFLELETEMV